MTPGKWRTGRKVFRTIYADDKLIGVMDSIEDAKAIVELVDEVTRLRDALEAIANDPHQSYATHEVQSAEQGQYRIGVADGHRCAAQTARDALGEKR